MAADEKWYFTKEQLTNTPSRRCGIDADKELSYRQQAANFIQDMGQRLVVTQLCINTAIVYMHRFYVFHSLSHFHRNSIAAAALFLAAKVEEQPRKLEHVIKVAHLCLHRDQQPPDIRSEQYLEQAQDLVFNENVLLQTLGFDVAIDHPHTHVVRCCQLVKASKDLAQTSYFMASNSLHLTTMCLQYKPTVVACFCIHLACKWSNWEIPQSNEGKHWFWYVDRTVTSELLQQLTADFLHIFDKCPSRLKKKIMSISANQSPSINHQSLPNSPFDAEPRKVSSAASAADGGPTFHSNRPHHTDKQEEKKQLPPTNVRPPVDYREYREKKERERLEREKTTTPATSVQSHAADINKHHSHHHKPVSGTNLPNKHSVPPGQKTTVHHNHHHRPEMKVSQPVPQRHSTGNQPRELNRDPNRQRIQREYNSSSSSSSNTMHSHGHTMHQTKDTNVENTLPDATSHRSDAAPLQDNLSNNNHNLQRLNAMDGKHQPHDKRVYDPRHKTVDHRKDGEQKAYNKYPDSSRDRQRKPDILEQRCEEVRKLIEKPLPFPKPALEVQQHAANIQKQSYHGKYSQPDKSQGSTSTFTSDVKATAMAQNAFSQEKSPTTPASALPQISQKSISSKPTSNQHSSYGVSQTLKDSIKNGNSQSSCLTPLNNIDDPKAEKRPRHDESADQQQNLLQTPVSTKHKSLFSPEKVQTSRESHSQRPKSKQKTPPSAVKVPKQERAPETLAGLNLVSPFASPPGLQQTESMSMKRSASDVSTTSHKRHRTASSSENDSQLKTKMEDTSSLEAMKMLGRVPELIQPIRDNPSANGRSTSVANDLQPPELIKPFEPEPVIPRFGHIVTNGLDAGVDMQQQQQVQMEYLSPMKSAQSISALLQEPLAPLPSLLQGMQQFSQITSQQTHPEQIVQQEQQQQPQLQQPQSQAQMQVQVPSQALHQHQHSHHHQHQHQQQTIHPHSLLIPDSQLAVQTQCMTLPTSMSETSIASTVDISVLSAPIQSTTDIIAQTVPPPTIQPVVPILVEEKRSEHHKSEKKKKKEKHKHKDKEKNKDKHKHKHKDKDKERHRDKDKEKSEETLTAAPIKITIPKEKLNLSGESAVTSGGTIVIPTDKNKSPQGTGLKLKILKDRLKSSTESVPSTQAQPVPQAPLKMKIRTDAIWRSSTGGGSVPVTTTSASSTIGVPDYSAESRKRERIDNNESTSNVLAPPTKKQQQQLQQQQQQSQQISSMAGGYGQHRPGERQNGRHYSSGSNNKERHTSSHHKSTSKVSQSQQSHAT